MFLDTLTALSTNQIIGLSDSSSSVHMEAPTWFQANLNRAAYLLGGTSIPKIDQLGRSTSICDNANSDSIWMYVQPVILHIMYISS